jgi:hypothetical protein
MDDHWVASCDKGDFPGILLLLGSSEVVMISHWLIAVLVMMRFR